MGILSPVAALPVCQIPLRAYILLDVYILYTAFLFTSLKIYLMPFGTGMLKQNKE
jgi:hypothetical protein